ncbi:uncharacterized protein LOC122259801 [Penaeus japonicus]|uniref:uncharacterized protein LOC122259801 n=1 Tax=Penaeus japonicus TaxID=27405 RepID=UPI001C717490|nr:uncharacterized protein LOC122259801 [Penaeus japonicus]
MMKEIAVLLFVALFALTRAQDPQEPWCNCAAFVSYEHSEIKVYQGPVINLNHCDHTDQCKVACVAELESLTNNGDLFYEVDGQTVGQYICTSLADNMFFVMNNKYVYGYFEVCGGAWQYTGIKAQQKLCCTNGIHKHCTE